MKPARPNLLVVPSPTTGVGGEAADADRPGNDDNRGLAEPVYLTEAELQFIDYLVDMGVDKWTRS